LLLHGKRVFVLELDGALHIVEVAKGYDNLVLTEDFSITIISPIIGLYAYHIMEEIIKDNFTRTFEFEIIQVIKEVDENHAYIIAISPNQMIQSMKFKVAIIGELIQLTTTKSSGSPN